MGVKNQSELERRLELVYEELRLISKDYKKDVEIVFGATTFDEEKPLKSLEFVSVHAVNNFDYYKANLERRKANFVERAYYADYAQVGEFRVVCNNVQFDPAMVRIFKKNNCRLVEAGSEYVCTSVSQLPDGTVILKLSDEFGMPMRCPKPYWGWSAARFSVIDYTKLN